MKWELEAETNTLSEEDRQKWMDTRILWIEKDRMQSESLKQKSRVKWNLEGDANTKFFHSSVKRRQSRNHISGLMVDGTWATTPNQIIKESFEYFKKVFTSTDAEDRPAYHSDGYKKLSIQEAASLEEMFTESEVIEAIKSCDGSKALGLDGFNFKFLNFFWPVIKKDLLNALMWFWETGHITRGCNATFVTLIPKVTDPLTLKDFRPISLVGDYYKIIAKLLANRLRKVIGKLIGEEQNAFLQGRFILDGVLIANETVSFLQQVKEKSVIFKIDIEKAYGKLEWRFLMNSMSQMGFGNRWLNWINSALQSATLSILINGSPTNEFNMTRGVRQGDPLAPFLFLLAAEGLNQVCKEALDKDLVKGVQVGDNKVRLFHLKYADDTIIFTPWDKRNVKNIQLLLKCFEMASGLGVNMTKSCVYGVGASQDEVLSLAARMGCKHGSFPIKYLGLPIGTNMGRLASWQPILDKFKNILSGWKAKCLSFGGRLTLVKSVLGSLPLYYFSLFRAPAGILNTLEKVRRKFFWGGGNDASNKLCWVKWENILSNGELGGLNIGSLNAHNISLLAKWWWRFRVKKDSLWVRVIKSIYGSNGGLSPYASNRVKYTSTWGNIIKVGCVIQKLNINWVESFRWVVGNGESISFWDDIWVGNVRLLDKFNRLYKLEKNSAARLSERGSWVNGNWEWKWDWSVNPRGRSLDELESLKNMLESICVSQVHEDKWFWTMSKEGIFEAKTLRQLVDQQLLHPLMEDFQKTRWSLLLPSKICIFIWRALKGRIPVRVELDRRGVDIPSLLCPLCNDAVENIDHALVRCRVSSQIWKSFFSWWDVNDLGAIDLHELLNHPGLGSWNKHQRQLWEAAIWSFLYQLWKLRNEVVFNNARLQLPDRFMELKWRSFLWIHTRTKKGSLDWRSWLTFPALSLTRNQ